MKGFKVFAVATVAALCLAASAPSVQAQVSINLNFGAQPVCPYGYFDYAPYQCAPFGYYGPTWFVGGVFIGAGPWFHGPVGFHGYVDRHYDPRYGYHGPFPGRGEHADWGQHRGWEHNFHGTESRQEVRHSNGHPGGQNRAHGNPHAEHGNSHAQANRGNSEKSHSREQKSHPQENKDHHNHD